MGFSVNTNIAALQAQTYVNANSDFQGKTINRVTSGLRIVNSGDDAAGLAIANGIRSDSAVLTQGIRNANDGLSQLQIIDGGINNISKLLDRARTLATQSASGTFTGSRTVLNSEFQSVIQEVDRQAQAIGLNSGGSFARSLSVFIGGGKASNGISASSNGSASVDLSQSTVDAQSLGLKGVQAKGVDATDIGTGSSTTSLSQILSNTANTNSQAVANTAQFTLRGPGFGSQGVNINVNTNSVGGTSDLVTRVNAAIESAGNGGTQAATALKNANIKASVVTDSSGRQQLAFTSPTTAFQVEAGDRTANALLGKYERNAELTGSNSAVSIDTSGGGTANVLTLAFEGGSAFNVTLTANAVQGKTSKGSLVAQLNADSGFAAKAKAYLSGDQLVIKSKDNTSSSQIVVTDTTLSRNLGLTSSASAVTVTAGSASTGADVTTRVQGNRAVAGGATARSTDNNATLTIAGASDNLNLTIAGKTGSLTLTNGTGLTKQQIAADINTQITASGTGATGLDGLVSASVVNNQIVLTAANAGDSVTIATGTNAAGFTAGETFTSNTFYSNDNIKVRFQGGGLESPVDISLNATTSGTTTVSTVLTDLVSRVATNSSLQAAGITLSSTSSGNNLVFQSASGETFQVAVTGDTQNKLGFGSFQADSSAAFDYSSIQAGSTFTGTFDPAFASQTSTIEFSLNGGASNTNAITVTQLADRGIVNGTGVGTGNITLAGTTLNLSIDGGTTQTFTLTTGTTISALATEINATLTGGLAEVVGSGASSALRIRSNTTGSLSSVLIQTGSTAAADLGLAAGQLGQGNSASTIQNDIRDQINTAIAGDAELRNAGLQASFSANKLTLASNNNTFFRVNTFGNTDLGFGVNGSTFSGTEVQGASATSATINSGGADSTTSLTFSGIAYGGDDQQVNITASDAAGTKQSLSVTLRNDATSRNARTIDDAVKAINDSLQQSNNETLKKIFAVKENTGGAEKIRFLSTVKNFEVAIGSTPGSTGFSQPTGGIDKAATVGTGSNASIDTQAAAESAVAALADAVSALGTSQAVVGRGQNQFNFAVNLAQSQLTNLAASESRIRDADLASEAANLSKAQILIQAGVAALAQANSAPQQVLSLLRG
jgi:flagellin